MNLKHNQIFVYPFEDLEFEGAEGLMCHGFAAVFSSHAAAYCHLYLNWPKFESREIWDVISSFIELDRSPLPLSDGWGSLGEVEFHERHGIISVSGAVSKGFDGDWKSIANLPPRRRPEHRLCYIGTQIGGCIRIDVLPSGCILFQAGNKNGKDLFLDSIQFALPEVSKISMTLLNGFVPYLRTWQPPVYYRHGDFVYLAGVVKDGNMHAPITQLPDGFRPSKHLCFLLPVYNSFCRVDVYPNGDVMFVCGKEIMWVILDGIRFALDGVNSEPLDLQNCWEPYEHDERLDGYGHPVIYENKGMIHLSRKRTG